LTIRRILWWVNARAEPRLLAALLALAGCDLGPDYHSPSLEVPAAYRASAETAATAWPAADWWRGFRSPQLDTLIEAAHAQNFDIAAAIARVRQADAQLRIAGAALLPTLGASGNATWQKTGLETSTGATSIGGQSLNRTIDSRSYSTGLNAAYEIDFWGKNRANRAAAGVGAVFSRFDQQTVALTVVANVATTWFTALAYADRLEVARHNLADAEQTLAVIRGRFDAGTANALDVAQQESQVAIERAVIPNFQSLENQEIIALGILIGRPPEAVEVQPGTLNTLALPVVSPGLPSELLRRRPDVAAAEAQLVAQNFSIQAARAAFFPNVQLTGSAGFEGVALNHLLGPGGELLSLAAGVTQPIFDGGTLRGQLEQSQGRYDELLADYRKAVVQAFTDVDQALNAWRFATEQERLQRIAVETAQRAADIARAQMQAGTVDVTTVLTTETTLFSAEDTLVQIRLARFQALLNLYQALGGGWAEPPGAIADQTPGLSPAALPGGVALPVGGNVR
jgi:NodT family efflux transporter outer membrane factor (OMF) lipoprotein